MIRSVLPSCRTAISAGVASLSLGALLMIAIGMVQAGEHAHPDESAPGWVRQAEMLTLRAGQGDLDAQVRLAERYERGRGVPQNYATAIGMYRAAAMRGHTGARRRLAALGVSLVAPEPEADAAASPQTATAPPVIHAESGSEHTSLANGSRTGATGKVFLLVRPDRVGGHGFDSLRPPVAVDERRFAPPKHRHHRPGLVRRGTAGMPIR